MIFELKEFSPKRWSDFVSTYTPLLKCWMEKKGVSASAQDDVLQESLKSIFSGIGNFERDTARGSFRGWLRLIVERRAADYFRSLPREQRLEQEQLQQVVSAQQKDADEIEVEQQALAEVKARALELVRQSTAETTWKMFWLSTVEGVPTAEISKQFGVTSAAVRVNKKRVLQRLKDLMIDDVIDSS
jgi:RNA polymerase sigma factor (sigma-70 family)